MLRSTAVLGLAGTVGCLGVLGEGDGVPPADEFPPGTDDTGVTDAEALFEAHRDGLAESSYTYRLKLTDSAKTGVRNVTARTAAGTDGPRFVRERELVVLEEDPSYRAEVDLTTDTWHGAETPSGEEFRHVERDVSVDDPSAYRSGSERAESYPPGEDTSYERREGDALASHHETAPRGLVLQALAFEFDAANAIDEHHAFEFVVAGLGSDVEEHPRYSGDDVSVSGALLVLSSGVVRRATVTVEPDWSVDVGHVSMAISQVGSTTVREEPPWVEREFGDA